MSDGSPKSRYSDYVPKGAARDLWLSTDPELILHGPAETGKSRLMGERLLWLSETWPGLRVLVVRKTRKSLSESFVQTFERLVLPAGHPLLAKRINPTNRHSYDFENGSRIVLGSMETPEAYYSTEWDFVWCEEATEFSEDQWERFFRAIRFRTIPHPLGPDPVTGDPRYLNQLIGTCNPDSERHWIQNRSKRKGPDGKPLLRLIQSRHADNPTFTSQSQARLDRMTGVRRKRLRDGIWSSAEGAIWENFDRAVHVIPDHPRQADKLSLAYEYCVAGVDWGTTHAGCIAVYGVDYDGRMFRAWEVMREGWGPSQWVERAVDIDRQWRPKAFVCDSADPGRILEFRKAGLPAVAVQKTGQGNKGFVWLSLDLVRDRLAIQPDGRPRLYFVGDQFDAPDPNMVEAGKPTCTEDEIPSYVLERDRTTGRIVEGKPADNQDDHACFPAGTLVLMSDGSTRPIEAVRTGESVWHPDGPQKVIGARQTGWGQVLEITHESGILRCTEDHPIYVIGHGHLPAHSLASGMVLECAINALSTTESHGTATPKPTTGEASITPDGFRLLRDTDTDSRELECDSTDTSGSKRTAGFPRECTFTTATEIRRITASKTSNWLARSVTGSFTACTRMGLSRSESELVDRPAKRQGHASGADAISSRARSIVRRFVRWPARPSGDATPESTTNQGRADAAALSSLSADTRRFGTVLVPVRSIRVVSRDVVPVFNLTVTPTHEFFADGVRVGNCAAMRYAVAYVERYNQTGARAGERGPDQTTQPACMWDLGPHDGLEQKVLSGELQRERDEDEQD